MNGAALVAARIAAWNAAHPSQKLDPSAVLAVSGTEGLGGGIGDGGHAFGPFQVNNAGGVITGKFQGQTPTQINQWAWTPAGIDYALAGIARVAGGQSGSRAVNSIVSGFERPANIPREISAANAALGTTPTSTFAPISTPVAIPTSTASATPGMSAQTQALLEALLASHPANQAAVTPSITPLTHTLAPAVAAPVGRLAAPAPLTLSGPTVVAPSLLG